MWQVFGPSGLWNSLKPQALRFGEPIATPTLACVKAGASLIPSPITATLPCQQTIYARDFRPEEQFGSDRTAILIYAPKAVSGGDTVRDLSGNGNEGRVERF